MELDPEGFQHVYPFACFVEGDVGTGKDRSTLNKTSPAGTEHTKCSERRSLSTQVPQLLPPVLSMEGNVSKRH